MKQLRERYECLQQMSMLMHGHTLKTDDKCVDLKYRNALSEVKELINKSEQNKPLRNHINYHKYMTRQMEQKPLPYATKRVGNDMIENLKIQLEDDTGKLALDLQFETGPGNWHTRDIPADREIIGFYCNTQVDSHYIKDFGIVTWVPSL